MAPPDEKLEELPEGGGRTCERTDIRKGRRAEWYNTEKAAKRKRYERA